MNDKNYVDVTEYFLHVIDAFACDFDLAIDDKNILLNINNRIQNKDKRILQDIDRLSALSFYMRHGKIRLIKEEKGYF